MGNDERHEEAGLSKMEYLITKYLMTVACYNDEKNKKENKEIPLDKMTDEGGLQAQCGDQSDRQLVLVERREEQFPPFHNWSSIPYRPYTSHSPSLLSTCGQ